MNNNIKKFLASIDRSKEVKEGVYFYDLCASEFEIHNYLTQSTGKERLTYCYAHTWLCTDTYVGIKVWYFDSKPVCVSYKPYRKYTEMFNWLSKDSYSTVREYANSLVIADVDENNITLLTEDHLDSAFETIKCINIKPFEKINYAKELLQ